MHKRSYIGKERAWSDMGMGKKWLWTIRCYSCQLCNIWIKLRLWTHTESRWISWRIRIELIRSSVDGIRLIFVRIEERFTKAPLIRKGKRRRLFKKNRLISQMSRKNSKRNSMKHSNTKTRRERKHKISKGLSPKRRSITRDSKKK